MPFKSILIVDDTDCCRTLLERCLLKEFPGIKIFQASGGEEGVAVFLEKFPDMTITDLNMPGMHGHEVVKRIKGIRKDAVVVIMTGNDGEPIEDITHADAFFRKGASDEDIIATLFSAVARKF